MKPVLALVGRPNVGKSTLFNRLTKSRDAIVADFAGLTRDRHYGNGKQGRQEFIVIDTGGFEPDASSGIYKEMAKQTQQAVAEADVVADQRPLQAALLAVMGHHSYRSPSLRGGVLPYLSCPRLTPREYQVLDCLASGLSDREIARQLMVSEATARTYTKRLLQTLGVNNRLQAVLKGMRCGMVQI